MSLGLAGASHSRAAEWVDKFFTEELEAHVPRDILACREVSREVNFSSVEKMVPCRVVCLVSIADFPARVLDQFHTSGCWHGSAERRRAICLLASIDACLWPSARASARGRVLYGLWAPHTDT